MGNFKVGDKVRILGNRNYKGFPTIFTNNLKIGDIVTLKEPTGDKTLTWESWWIKEGSQWMRSDDLELVTEISQPSFVKVIPERREIVETRISLGHIKDFATFSTGRFSTGGNEEKDCLLIDFHSHYVGLEAKYLRELADHFNTAASILEENAK